MFDDLIPLALLVVLVPMAALIVFRLLAKTKRTRRPLNSFRDDNDRSNQSSRFNR